MLIEEKLEKWVGELSADKRRLQEQLEAVTREKDTCFKAADMLAKIGLETRTKLEAAEARAARQREAIAEIQAIAMLAEGNATLSAIGHVARAALSEDSVKEAG